VEAWELKVAAWAPDGAGREGGGLDAGAPGAGGVRLVCVDACGVKWGRGGWMMYGNREVQ